MCRSVFDLRLSHMTGWSVDLERNPLDKCTTRLAAPSGSSQTGLLAHLKCLFWFRESTNYCYACSVIMGFPGIPPKIHGLFAQNSSLWISTCSTTTLAFVLAFRIFSLCVFDSTAASSV